MSAMMQWILYGVLVLILGVVGYYVGKNYASIGPMYGAGIGAAVGVVLAIGMRYMQSDDMSDDKDVRVW